MTHNLSIAKDFSRTPGSRYISEGPHSGEQFRADVLTPVVAKALAAKGELFVDLDGTAGYGTSFLEEAFGGLIRTNVISGPELLRILKLKSDQEPYLIDDVLEYINDAQAVRNGTSS